MKNTYIDDLEKDNIELKGLVKGLLDTLRRASLACENLHHEKKDQHKIGEHCPVEDRIRNAIGRVQEKYNL